MNDPWALTDRTPAVTYIELWYQRTGVERWTGAQLTQLAKSMTRTPAEIGALAGVPTKVVKRITSTPGETFSLSASIHFEIIRRWFHEMSTGIPATPVTPVHLLNDD